MRQEVVNVRDYMMSLTDHSERALTPGPRSACRLGGITEKFDSPPYSEWMAVSKMVASIGRRPFGIKRTIVIG